MVGSPAARLTILSDRELDFASLRPGPPEFQLAGDADRVALTCAALGVDASDLELPVPLDRSAYRRSVERLTGRGLIENGRLTRYGRQVEALPVERPWAELLVHADAETMPLVAGASGIDSLHRMTREERDLHGVLVPGSDHLTAYNLLAEAVNSCGRIGEVHGLPRHVFDEVQLAAWADRRGVLMKAIEDGALGMASAYRALDLQLPDVLPHADHNLRARFIELVARIEPFDLVLDEQTADGQSVRISKTSVAGTWGAIAGTLRYFADRSGTARASIEGTTVPYELLRKYAVQGPATVTLTRYKQGQELAISRRLEYFGFNLERGLDRIRGDIPVEYLDAARTTLANALLAGDVEHPYRARLDRAVKELDEYWRRSGGALKGVDRDALRALIRAQLEDVTSWEEFQRTPVQIDVAAMVPAEARAHLDSLPGALHVRGDAATLEYEVRNGEGVLRAYLREGQARRLKQSDLPQFDRPLVFAVRRRGEVLQAETVSALQELLERSGPSLSGRNERHDGDDKRRQPHQRPRGGTVAAARAAGPAVRRSYRR